MPDQDETINKALELKKSLLETMPNIRCFVISILENNSEYPIVIYHGDQLEYTALSVEVAKALRKRIIDRIDGNTNQPSQQPNQ